MSLNSAESAKLSFLWMGLFFSPLVFPHLPPKCDLYLADCSRGGRIIDCIKLPQHSSSANYTAVVFCFAAGGQEGLGNPPFSMLIVTNRAASWTKAGPVAGVADRLFLTHFASVECSLQKKAVGLFAGELQSQGWDILFLDQPVVGNDFEERAAGT
jgi:hypothetical protein